MPLYELEVMADAVIWELWRVEAEDAEEAEEIFGSHGDFVDQIRVDHEDNREIVSVEEIDPTDAVPAQADRDARALNKLSAYLRENEQWNGGDFCELAATEIARTGRRI